MSNTRNAERNNIVIAPAGKRAKERANQLMKNGYCVLCFCDNNTELQSDCYNDIPIISVDEATSIYSSELFFVITDDDNISGSLTEQLASNGVQRNNINYYTQYNYLSDLDEMEYPNEIKKMYERSTGKKLDYSSVISFNEKIQWLRAYDMPSIATTLSDKFEARNWVKKRVGSKYLTPIYGVWHNFDDINFDELPNSFVLKCNHGCGYNIIVKDKKKLDIFAAKEIIDKWMKTNYAFEFLETQYKDIIPQIICEQYIETQDGTLFDYKFHCFNGNPEYVYIVRGRDTCKVKERSYNMNWEPQEFVYNGNELDDVILDCPGNFSEMLNVAKKLCEGFKYVRVDLYRLNNGDIRFGEMTFTPSGGVARWVPEEYDLIMGKKIII